MDDTLRTRIDQWLQWDQDPSTRTEVERLVTAKSYDELTRRMIGNIKFGTAGLRGRMQAGFNYINCLTVIQASQGIATHLKHSQSDNKVEQQVIIGHDARHNSKKYARLAANAFESQGFRVCSFEKYVPTPFVAFGVRLLDAALGVMITASHNPAMDNGYKVYGRNGAGINTPVDKILADSILRNQEPWPTAWNEKQPDASANTLVSYVSDAYVKGLVDWPRYGLGTAASTASTFLGGVYTPVHGVGWEAMAKVAAKCNNCTLQPVAAQVVPDPEFPTVKFPNPEEDGALDLALQTADETLQTVVLANDPDADRFAAAEKVNGKWHKFTGDQIGVLLGNYLIQHELRKGGNEKVMLLASAVSSTMLQKVVLKANSVWRASNGTEKSKFSFEETLTGFKWLGNRAYQLQLDGYKVLFGYEEALGYMFPELGLLDKDGIAACSLYLRAMQQWHEERQTPFEILETLYKEHGYHETLNTYFISPSAQITTSFFEAVRNSSEFHSKVLGQFAITFWRDVTNGLESLIAPLRSGQATATLPRDPESQMLTFHLKPLGISGETIGDEAIVFTLRGSGTEPKIKLYLECCAGLKLHSQAVAARAFDVIVECWVKELGQGLVLPKEVISSSGARRAVES